MIFYALKFDKTEFKNHMGPWVNIAHCIVSWSHSNSFSFLGYVHGAFLSFELDDPNSFLNMEKSSQDILQSISLCVLCKIVPKVWNDMMVITLAFVGELFIYLFSKHGLFSFFGMHFKTSIL